MNCSCCNAANDTIGEVKILLQRKLAAGRPATIPLCAACVNALPFDIGALIDHANTFREYEDDRLKDAILGDFLSRFIRDIWVENGPPSIQDLCDVLNSIGLRTQTGRLWTYNNLKYKLAQLRVDRDAYALDRNTASYADRLKTLQEQATIYLFQQPQYQPLPTPREPQQITLLPPDMPGQLTPPELAGKL